MVLLFSRVEPFVQFGRRHHEEKFCEIILNGPVVQEEM